MEPCRYRNQGRAIIYALIGGCGMSVIVSVTWAMMFVRFVKFGSAVGDVLDTRSVGVMVVFFLGLIGLMGVSVWVGTVGGLGLAVRREKREFSIPPSKRQENGGKHGSQG